MIIDQYIKIIRYVSCNKTIDVKSLIDLVIDEVIQSYNILKGIVINRESVFTNSY
jgi:hypothetical protein